MKPALLVAWRPAPFRTEAWAHLRPIYETLGWPIYEADTGAEPFSRSGSRNLAAHDAGAWDVGILLDADCLCDLDNLRAAVRAISGSRSPDGPFGILLPHNSYVYLSPAQTERMIHAEWTPRSNALYLPRLAPGGALVVTRAAWNTLGGYDERFVGWGKEDSDLLTRAYAAGIHVERWAGKLFHLWHPSDNPQTRAEEAQHDDDPRGR